MLRASVHELLLVMTLSLPYDVVGVRITSVIGEPANAIYRKATQPKYECQQGFNPPFGTRCPVKPWLASMVKTDPSPAKVAVNVGCNKGYDAMMWMEMWDPSSPGFWKTSLWKKHLFDLGVIRYSCPPTTVTADMKTSSKGGELAPRVVCIEAAKANYDMLNATRSFLNYTFTSVGKFDIIYAAIASSESPGQMVDFPDIYPGTETGRVPAMLAPVPVRTVDSIVKGLGLAHVDILSIDTEGADPDVLFGARSTLSSVRYLEFEVHRDMTGSAWSNHTLRAVVDGLPAFECFWAGNNGRLVNIKACWSNAFERGTWANAVCAKKGDPWLPLLQEYA
eukprot:gnl/TRDRNA2_/TRDRNA2_189441_c0_seq1.p1 gnl/TRDRNA2_/TRDRNA2_189441_c0~~gnl/TRDRNA2_/TRDRNA2_189441_c0_seq1.p1  ORF type:complete len:336 (+),score=37.15 gnl/TRDRNA2_/TRDRNA2_189441_c0_seq1:80-1087(+)